MKRRRPKVKRLRWGETPWENFSKEQLLHELKIYYSTVLSLNSCLSMSQVGYPKDDVYWGADGSGGKALRKAAFALNQLKDEPAFNTFFRYADDLLFEGREGTSSEWRICDKCGTMLASGEEPSTICIFDKGPMRPLKWTDLDKK